MGSGSNEQHTGFVLNYEPDPVYINGKYQSYYANMDFTSDTQPVASWRPARMLFNGWPSGKSEEFGEYTVLFASSDSLAINSETTSLQYPSLEKGLISVYKNRSDLLMVY